MKKVSKNIEKAAQKLGKKHGTYTVHNLKNRYDSLRLDVAAARARKRLAKSA